MLSINVINFLAMATAVVAIPSYRQHGHKHMHLHASHPSGVAPSGTASVAIPYPYPYPSGNSTGVWGSTGMVGPTEASSYLPLSSTVAVSPVTEGSTSVYSGVGNSSTCTTDMTITSTTTIAVTVTINETNSAAASTTEASVPVSSSSAAASSSSVASSAEVSPVMPSTSSTPAASITYEGAQKAHRHTRSWSAAAPVSTTSSSSSVAAPVSIKPSSSSVVVVSTPTSSYVAPTTPVSSATSVKTTPSSTYSSSASSYPSGSVGTGKRGLAYNDASLTTCFESDSQVSWAYNWGSSSSGLSSAFKFVPLLWGTSSDFTSSWNENAKAAIKAGSTHLMAFNEPDLSTQANLSPQAAAAAYRTWMMPFANTGVKLGAPSVTNGGGATGLNWLSSFLTECSDCQIDFVNIHWYDSYTNSAYFKEHVQNATDVAGGKSVFVSEFGTVDGSSDDISAFLEDVMPWMDSQPYVEAYAYFMVSNGVLVNGGEQSSYGSVYATYTA